ncbi:hypothetical protein IV73_GL000142 [Weissella kandleri]|uniref:Uncharacterized protein n=1 Tax=Weissella kandleri TaxID=1616 RepID=A0A0R2JNG1_9LACO|nr:hypothetical protein [Weissella kandleri]KRN75652.1 hypothetical protein IV73_GL000142 [Weissella kandleri]
MAISNFELQKLEGKRDELKRSFDKKAEDLLNLYAGDDAVPGLLEDLMDLNKQYKDQDDFIENRGYNE